MEKDTLEEWKPIKGFEEMYLVSSLGKVKSLERKVGGRPIKEKLMKLHVHTNKYQVVWLRKPGHHVKFYVHRIVAFHFFAKPEGKDYVNHKDKNRMNNCVMNLEWCTHEENIEHRDAERRKMIEENKVF